jgi:hypothetical protein
LPLLPPRPLFQKPAEIDEPNRPLCAVSLYVPVLSLTRRELVLTFFSQATAARRHPNKGRRYGMQLAKQGRFFVAQLISSLVKTATLASNSDLERMQYWQAT